MNTSELVEFTLELVVIVQQQCFSDESKRLQHLSACSSSKAFFYSWKVLKHSSIRKFNSVFVNGVLRLGGILQWSPLLLETRHPILLPAKHHFTSLVIDFYRCNVGHSGALQTLAATREHFWILNGCSAVRRVIKGYAVCRRAIASPGTRFMATLPKFKVTPGHPAFTCVGLDFAGPFMTKNERSLTKRYLCLFTCLASRAVHLEIAFSLDIDSFLQCFTRFYSRHITPDHVFSDNRSNFVGAEQELRGGIRRCATHLVLSKRAMKGVQWHFNPPGSSHYGGIWKRLICSFCSIFTAIVSSTRLDDQALITYATEVECILNDYPLTSVSADSKDLLALTPNTLLKS